MARMTNEAPAVTLERREGPYGEVVLRRRGGRYEIIANGCFLMDTSDGRSERLLVSAALDALPAATEHPSLLLGGLGVGFSLAEAARGRWGRITVVEREQAVVDWHVGGGTDGGAPENARTDGGGQGGDGGSAAERAWLAPFSAGALTDPRVRVVLADLVGYIRSASGTHDAICLDIDNGPDWTVTEGNTGLYGPDGLRALRRLLAPGGVLAVWSARSCPPFLERLRAHFADVRELPVEVVRGEPDVVYVAYGSSGRGNG
jgi:spermidine synthase